jgi:hypothetical protein
MVTKLGTSVSITNTYNPDANWFGVEVTDWTIMHTRGTTLRTSMPSITTSATTDLFVAGLDAGTYEVRLNGTPISGCTAIPVIIGDSTVLCEGVSAGDVTVVQTGSPPAPIVINTTTLPAGTTGSAYSQTLSISGGTSPYACTVTVGTLPTGLSISVATISGTPTVAATSNFTVSCTDSLGATPDTQALSITIAAPGGSIVINTTTLPNGTQNSPYSQVLSVSGGTPPYACTVTVGTLPTGLSISVATISGTPLGTGASSFTVSCTDSILGTPDTQALSITINAVPVGARFGGAGTHVRGATIRIR